MAGSFWDSSIRPIPVAHRGGGAAFEKEKHLRENTLEAFKQSVALGYQFLEMDVIQTADKEVIVIHVAKNKFEAKQRKKDAPDYDSLQNATYDELKTSLKREIPRLSEVLSSLPKIKLLIDAKSDKAVEPLTKLISDLDVGERICCGSFYPDRVLKLHERLGDRTSYRLVVSRSLAHLYSQWRSFNKLQDIISAVDLPYLYLNKRSIAYLHKKGLKALIWTPNTPSQINKAKECDADGIITDDIRLLKQILDS